MDGKVWSQNNGFAAVHRLDLKTGADRDHRAVQGFEGRREPQHLRHHPGLRRTTSISPTLPSSTSAGSTPRPGRPRCSNCPPRPRRPRRGMIDDAGPHLVRRVSRQQDRHVRHQDARSSRNGRCRPRGRAPYDVTIDKTGHVWTGSMLNDRVSGSTRRPASSSSICCRAKPTSAAFSSITPTTPATFWVGNNHQGSIVKVEPLN